MTPRWREWYEMRLQCEAFGCTALPGERCPSCGLRVPKAEKLVLPKPKKQWAAKWE